MKYLRWPHFVGGLIAGLMIYHVVSRYAGFVLVDQNLFDTQKIQLGELEKENQELTDDLLLTQLGSRAERLKDEPPYKDIEKADLAVSEARAKAIEDKQFLMVTFGANWCMDCRNLHRQLQSEEVRNYTDGLFSFVNVDVGKLNQNKSLAESLGVSLSRGIPVAIFFNPEGVAIGTTNNGQLEPSRHYTSKQILKFIKDVAENSRILEPDSIH